ncbi:hypothetical protein Glove_313g50 [Diversispora epigaea]|uniref:Uncharacterized protein n=1 Tax=Diversispora epigaea TaxID=1348612 RepID=A0A397HWM4_9GLOM|nr:hypothetical protein Glove_313g50 [Diversispora epigaea]
MVPGIADKGALIVLNSVIINSNARTNTHIDLLIIIVIIGRRRILEEYEHIEQNEKRFAKERENLIKLNSLSVQAKEIT